MTRLTLILIALLVATVGYVFYLGRVGSIENRRNQVLLEGMARQLAEMKPPTSVVAVEVAEPSVPSVDKTMEEALNASKEALVSCQRQLDESRAVKPAAAAPATSGGTYRVGRGENLWKISQKLYKTPWKWHQIWKLNESMLPDYRKLAVGSLLRLP